MSFDVAGVLHYFRERQVNAVSGQAQSAARAGSSADFAGALTTARTDAAKDTNPAPPDSPTSSAYHGQVLPGEVRRRVEAAPSRHQTYADEEPRLTEAMTSQLDDVSEVARELLLQNQVEAAGVQAPPASPQMTKAEENLLSARAFHDLKAIAQSNAKHQLAAKKIAESAQPERIKDLDPFQNQNAAPAELVLTAARSLLGKPYRSGGESPRGGFDCSGFTSYVYGKCGLELPRNSHQQYAEGRPVDPADLKAGDLVFFGAKKHIAHVGIYAGDGKFIHSGSDSGHVRISDLSDQYWKNKLVGCRRVL